MRRTFVSFILAGLLALTASYAQTAEQDIKGVGRDLKEAGKSVGEAAKKTGSATKRATKKVAGKSAKKVRQGAATIEDKVK